MNGANLYAVDNQGYDPYSLAIANPDRSLRVVLESCRRKDDEVSGVEGSGEVEESDENGNEGNGSAMGTKM